MSVLGKKWFILNQDKSKSTFEKILENRGFKNLEEGVHLHDPFLFSGMQDAVIRVRSAIEKNERIVVFGDYDVDGISAAAILVHTLKKLKANVSYRLPNRVSDGYGLSEKFIDEFIALNVGLIITVDCGISCQKPVKKAKENNIDTIITDHHSIPKIIPEEAYTILHPLLQGSNYPFKDLTGAGIALKFAQALIGEKEKDFFERLIDLAALGTVADLGPLTGENRYIVKNGLNNLLNTKWIGLKKLLELSSVEEGTKIDTHTIGFKIAPRINAAGRIGDPYLALKLLLQEEENEKVSELGNSLEELNKRRQELTVFALTEAENIFMTNEDLPYILIAENPSWHVGILGLVAGKLVEKYARPAIILQDFGDVLVASARSPQYFNMVEAISKHSKYLISFGGHAQAAGFNLKKENFLDFKNALLAYAEEKLKDHELKPVLPIDCELGLKDIDLKLSDEISSLEPFGIANEKPTFLLKDVTPKFISQVGKNSDHLKFSIDLPDSFVSVIAFNLGLFAPEVRKHKKLDLVFKIEINKWNNKEHLQLHAIDFEFHE